MPASASGDALTVGGVADLVGVSVRTLHHWDQVGIVRPTARTRAGYRSYSAADVGRIHRVLVYRELGFSLAQVAELLDDPDVDEMQHLRTQHRLLQEQLATLQHTADAVAQLLARRESGGVLTAQEQAEIFGRGWRQDWAEEAQERWGDSDEWRQYETNAMTFSPEDRLAIQQRGDALYAEMAQAQRAGVDPTSELGIALAERHRAMISTLFACTPDMHALLGRMYVEDPRFSDTIDAVETGLSLWLREAIYAAARAHGVDPAAAVWR